MSNSTASAKAEISENIINKLDLTVLIKISENNLIISTTDILSVSTIISILINLTALIAINTVNLNSESIITDLDDNSDELLKDILLNIIYRSVSYQNI